MHLLSSKKLETKLARRKLSEWDKTKYIIFTSIFAIAANPVFWPFPAYMRMEATTTTGLAASIGMICWIANALVTYIGIKNCFESNKLIDGKSFIERFSVLFVPVSVQMFLVGLIVIFGIGIGIYPITKDQKILQLLIEVASVGLLYIFFFLLNRSFLRLSIASEDVEVQQDGYTTRD